MKKSFRTAWVNLFYVGVLIVLGYFAKDNVIASANAWLNSDSRKSSAVINTVGSIEVAFSPNGEATASIIKALAKAQNTILVAAYSFTSQELASALLEAKKRNVVVKIILDKSQMTQRYSSATFFANMGFDLKIDVKHAIFHNKVMIIDDATVITGSFNFTKAAETKNAENVLIIRDNPKLARLYAENWWRHWNQALPREDFLKQKLKNN